MSPTTTLLITFVVGALILTWALRHLLREIRELKQPDASTALVLMQQQLDALRDQVRSSLEDGRDALDRRLQDTNRAVGEVSRGLGAVDRQVRAVGDTAAELRGLQELLRSPNVRGGMGEYLLAELLAQVLPQANFRLQHQFSGGERVDAVLSLGDRLVPIDAKFPLENFRRMRDAAAASDDNGKRAATRAFRADVRRHIDAISRKYVRPGEGTFEFAMMYLPAEAVYQELIHQQGQDGTELLHYALARRVVPVSPQSFYAYLQVIVFGLRGMNIERRARDILGRLGETRTRLDLFAESFEIGLRHLGNATRQLEEAGRRLERVDAAVTDLSREAEPRDSAPADEPQATSASVPSP